MGLTIASTTNLNDPTGEVQEVLVQFIGEKLSRLDYISGTVKLKPDFLQLSKDEKEQSVLDVIKKEFYPEPFNEDKIEEVSKTLKESKEAQDKVIESVKTEQAELKENNNNLSENIKNISKQVLKSDIAQEDYDKIISVFPEWITETSYVAGDTVRYEGKAWEVIQAHTSQPDWTPETATALFKEITPEKVVDEETGEEAEIIPDFVQPTGSHDTYDKGDKVLFQDKIYTSTVDNNSYSPIDYAEGWEEVVEEAVEETVEETE